VPDAIVRRTLEEFGRVDIIVNNAASAPTTRFPEISAAGGATRWRSTMTVPFLMIKAALETMKAQHYGRIINISSTAGRMVSTLGGAHLYCVQDGAPGPHPRRRQELGAFGITVNAVCPWHDRHGAHARERHPGTACPDRGRRSRCRAWARPARSADLICFAASDRRRLHHRNVPGHQRR